jgi:hypothetical protein
MARRVAEATASRVTAQDTEPGTEPAILHVDIDAFFARRGASASRPG